MDKTIVIDAGHGGADPGAVYEGRQEKDDALRLALALGNVLENNGINVIYTRTTDEYETPFKKATDANMAGADFFLSIHRNSSVRPQMYNGFETLVYDDSGIKAQMARNINEKMEEIGFKNNGITERPNLVVLKRTQMPALLLEAGFINNTMDNELFDEKFAQIVDGIAEGILETINHDENNGNPQRPPQNNPGSKLYRVQVGAYKNRESADRLLNSLLVEGFPAFVIYDDGLYKVQVGAYELLANAVAMEERLRKFRYNTYITT